MGAFAIKKADLNIKKLTPLITRSFRQKIKACLGVLEPGKVVYWPIHSKRCRINFVLA